MGSIVTKNVEPYKIVAGCPAKVIRKRFEEAVVEGLLKSKWWNFSDADLHKFASNFNDPKQFLAEFRK